jgi:hypothetical protein
MKGSRPLLKAGGSQHADEMPHKQPAGDDLADFSPKIPHQVVDIVRASTSRLFAMGSLLLAPEIYTHSAATRTPNHS